MIIDERYNDNVVFNKAGLQQLLDNIKTYPIINAEYLSDGEALTGSSPCVRITFGDSQSQAGFLTYALNFQADNEHSQAIYDTLLRQKQEAENGLAEKQQELDRINHLYNELVQMYDDTIDEIQAFSAKTSNDNQKNYQEMISYMAEILTNYINYVGAIPLNDFFDKKNDNEISIHFNNSNGVYDVTTFENVPTEKIFDNIKLYLQNIYGITFTEDVIYVFRDYNNIIYEIHEMQKSTADKLRMFELDTSNNGKQLNNAANEKLVALYQKIINASQGSENTEIITEIVNNISMSNLSILNELYQTEKDYITIIVLLGDFEKIVNKYYQTWVNNSTDVYIKANADGRIYQAGETYYTLENEEYKLVEQPSADWFNNYYIKNENVLAGTIGILKNYIVEYLGKAYVYKQCSENSEYNRNNTYYTKNNENEFEKVTINGITFNQNKTNYYIQEITPNGELNTKIQRANEIKQTLLDDINGNENLDPPKKGLNNTILRLEQQIQGYYDWAYTIIYGNPNTNPQVEAALSPEQQTALLGHAYLPVGSNITFYQPGTDTPLTISEASAANQATGTFRVSINSNTYEVPISGLAGGSGAITLSGDLVPSQHDTYNIGSDYVLATEYDEEETYYIYQIGDGQSEGFIEVIPKPTQDQFNSGETQYYIKSPRYWKKLYLSNSLNISGSEDGVQDTDPQGDFIEPEGSIWEAKGNENASITTNGGIYAAKNIYGKRVFNAVFNDYAECRKTINLEPGRVVIDQDDGSLACSSARLQPGAQVISDTYGHLMGADKGVTTPIAVAGRVLAYPFGDRNRFHAGMAVCSAPGGTIDIMTREEIQKYPDCIVGIVSEIPEYNIWGSGNIKVNKRIWIKVK